MELLKNTLNNIGDINIDYYNNAKHRVDNLIKPKGSLGKLENIAIRLSAITSNLYPKVDNKTIIVMAADNGVCEENVASVPQEVTKLQAINMTKGYCGVSALAKQAKANIVVVDVGIKSDVNNDNIINRKIKYGTDNFVKGSAMTREEAIKAIEVGIEVANDEIDKGCNLLGIGEMGIGNTTSSTAILSVIGDYDPYEITGIGANFPEDKVVHKANIIRKAIEVNKPDKDDPIDILSKVGGLEIGGMVGVILGSAAKKVPVVIDGYISIIAAIIAYELEPESVKYIFPSHSSAEKAATYAMDYLNLEPMLHMDMRLGEGSGAAMAFNIIEGATYMMKEMITFDESDIDPA
jgi:nicotinate-nucleotide--dimethylbenzimidazole phosphoribosyltransferase